MGWDGLESLRLAFVLRILQFERCKFRHWYHEGICCGDNIPCYVEGLSSQVQGGLCWRRTWQKRSTLGPLQKPRWHDCRQSFLREYQPIEDYLLTHQLWDSPSVTYVKISNMRPSEGFTLRVRIYIIFGFNHQDVPDSFESTQISIKTRRIHRKFTSFCSSRGLCISWFWMNSCSISKKSFTRSNLSSLSLHFDVGKIWGIFTAAAGPFFFFLFVTFAGAGFFFSFFSSSGLSPIL